MARAIGPRKVSRYTHEFKLKAVKLTELEGVQVKDVAEALEIHPWMLGSPPNRITGKKSRCCGP